MMKINYWIIFSIAIAMIGCSESTEETATDSTVEELTSTEDEVIEDQKDELDLLMETIDTKVDEMDNRHDWDDGLLFEVHESTEGGELMMYFMGSNIAFIDEHHYGEMGQVWNKYYLDDNELIFVKETDISYNYPMYMADTMEIEIDTLSNYSYFDGGILIRRYEDGDCGAPFADDYKLEEQQRILTRLEELKAYVED